MIGGDVSAEMRKNVPYARKLKGDILPREGEDRENYWSEGCGEGEKAVGGEKEWRLKFPLIIGVVSRELVVLGLYFCFLSIIRIIRPRFRRNKCIAAIVISRSRVGGELK